MDVRKSQEALENLHTEATNRNTKNKTNAHRTINACTSAESHDFHVVDYEIDRNIRGRKLIIVNIGSD